MPQKITDDDVDHFMHAIVRANGWAWTGVSDGCKQEYRDHARRQLAILDAYMELRAGHRENEIRTICEQARIDALLLAD